VKPESAISATDEFRLRILRVIEANPEISQRELADELGISLGKVNYCISGLVDRGLVKVRNFKNSKNKIAYAYLLTPRGIEEKTRVTLRYLKARVAEYDALVTEIDNIHSKRKVK
jgi:EPS-associated MarR family transcriptional regulator